MKNSFSQSEPKVPLSWIAVLRMMVGVMFITTWLINLLNGFYTPEGLQGFFTEVYPQSENPLMWYASFINGIILPIRSVFAPFQLVAEFVMGLALLLGAFTPFFSLAGIFFLVNTFLATLGHDWIWSYLIPIGILTVTMVTRSGRSLGVDAILLKRFGERRLWFW